MTTKEVAKDLIRVYVERGDTLKQIADGLLGVYCEDYSAHIGGYSKGKTISKYQLCVARIGKEEIFEVFKLEEIFNEIKLEAKQPALF